MIITIMCADTPQWDIKVECLDNYPDLGVVIKVAKAIQEYYEKQEFVKMEEKLGGLYDPQKKS